MMLVAVEGGKVGVDHRGNRYELAAGARVVVEAVHLSGDSLVIMEQLRRTE